MGLITTGYHISCLSFSRVRFTPSIISWLRQVFQVAERSGTTLFSLRIQQHCINCCHESSFILYICIISSIHPVLWIGAHASIATCRTHVAEYVFPRLVIFSSLRTNAWGSSQHVFCPFAPQRNSCVSPLMATPSGLFALVSIPFLLSFGCCPSCLMYAFLLENRLYHEPVSLPCGHTYCRGCLKRALANKSQVRLSRLLHDGSPWFGDHNTAEVEKGSQECKKSTWPIRHT